MGNTVERFNGACSDVGYRAASQLTVAVQSLNGGKDIPFRATEVAVAESQ